MIRPLFHIALHFLLPGLVAAGKFRDHFWRSFLLMSATIIVDLDHLIADPIYDPNRCSIGYHPLHTWPAVSAYFILLFIPRLRLIGIGLLIHMALDMLDCWAM